MHVALTNDAWAEIRDVDDLLDGDRKAVNAAVSIGVSPDGQMPVLPGSMDDDLRDALIGRLVTNWSFTHLPLPSDDIKSLDRLTIPDARLLHRAIEPHLNLVMGKEDPAKPGTVPTEG